VDREPEERRSYPSEAGPSESGLRKAPREEPFPHEEERPQDGLGRTWWRRMFRGPHEGDTERGERWWRRIFGG
jgi:hypothetical protein